MEAEVFRAVGLSFVGLEVGRSCQQLRHCWRDDVVYPFLTTFFNKSSWIYAWDTCDSSLAGFRCNLVVHICASLEQQLRDLEVIVLIF